MYYVYVLRCQDQSLYTGITTNPMRRFNEHTRKKGARYTRSHEPVNIVALWSCENRQLAAKLEYWFKKLAKTQKEDILKDDNLFGQYLHLKIDTAKYMRKGVALMNLLDGIRVLYHSSIRIEREKVIYVDPYHIMEEKHDADFIFVTHDHFDHYSPEDILKVKNNQTTLIVPESLKASVDNVFLKDKIVFVKPNSSYTIEGITFQTVPAYNVQKNFHPKANQWVGYVLEMNNYLYYIAGDTDLNEDNRKVKCDVAFIPIGGTYTFNIEEAIQFVEIIQPKIVVPTHYGSVVGQKEDGIQFQKLCPASVQCICLLDQETISYL